MSDKEESEQRVSPAADQAVGGLVKLFSDPKLPSKAQFRCGVEGPTEFDVLFESVIEKVFGDSEYKQWVKRPHDLGLIFSIARRVEI
jgi:hypothetical protein